MGRTNKLIGKLGEEIAGKFLISRGYTVVCRNFATPFGEIDLVAKEKGCTVFFEVKARVSEKFGPPLCSITNEKKKHIIKNCRFYLKKQGLYGKPCRIDAIAISLDKCRELKILKHVKNAIMIER